MTSTKPPEHTAYDCREFRYERGDFRCIVCGRKERYVSQIPHAERVRHSQGESK